LGSRLCFLFLCKLRFQFFYQLGQCFCGTFSSRAYIRKLPLLIMFTVLGSTALARILRGGARWGSFSCVSLCLRSPSAHYERDSSQLMQTYFKNWNKIEQPRRGLKKLLPQTCSRAGVEDHLSLTSLVNQWRCKNLLIGEDEEDATAHSGEDGCGEFGSVMN